MRLTWKKEPSLSGLASVGQGPRGKILSLDGAPIGWVYAARKGLCFEWDGWVWRAGNDIGMASVNTGTMRARLRGYPPRYSALESAQEACEKYVREQLGMPPKKVRK